MPFQQPASLIIRPYHFRGKTYSFPVESSIAPELGGGHFYVTVTDGYALQTSRHDLPQHQHVLDYEKQPDGSWLVRDTITVLVTASALLSGTITLRDPTGKTLRMTIQVEATLFIDESPIFFDTTEPGKSTAALLTIRQQGATTPISLRLGSSNAFAMADARMVSVTTARLTLTPSFDGSNVIVSYAPSKRGNHDAQLVITTPYTTKTIALVGQTGGLLSRLPALPTVAIPALLTKMRPSFTQPVLRRSHLIGALSVAVVGGLVWGSYLLLSRSKTNVDLAVLDKQINQPTGQLALLNTLEPKQDKQSVEDESKDVGTPKVDQPVLSTVTQPTDHQFDQDKLAVHIKSAPSQATSPKPATQTKLALVVPNEPNATRQAKPPIVSIDQESDLEKELNTPIYHKDRP